MRRGLAGLLFVVAAACLALAAGGWWLQRVAFDTATSAEIADVVLQEDAIRDQVVTIVASSAAGRLGVPESELRALVDQYVQADDPAIDAVLGQVVADSHARLIGARSEPVQITGAQLVPIVRNEVAFDFPPITIPVQTITELNVIRHGLDVVRAGDGGGRRGGAAAGPRRPPASPPTPSSASGCSCCSARPPCCCSAGSCLSTRCRRPIRAHGSA